MPSLLEEAAALSESLSAFVRASWHVVDSSPLEWSWPLEVLCIHLEAVSQGKIRRLVVNMPPRTGKSTIISVLWPAWDWTRDSTRRWLTSSYASDLSERDALATRRLIESPWFHDRWGWMLEISDDEAARSRYSVEAWMGPDGQPREPNEPGAFVVRGRRVATSTDARGTGEGGHVVTADDPNNVRRSESKTDRDTVNVWWDRVMSTRTAGDPKKAAWVVAQQRTHENDLTGHLLATGSWEHLCLPMEYDCIVRSTSLGQYDPRREPGELLFPERYSRAEVESLKLTLGPYSYAGQFQQTPSPASGGLFSRDHLRFWVPAGSGVSEARDDRGKIYAVRELPEVDEMLQSWDMSQKGVAQAIRDGRKPDKTAGHVWARAGVEFFLLDRVASMMDVTEGAAALLSMTEKWPQATAKLVEDKANGPAIMAMLRDRVAGLISVTPTASKQARVESAVVSTDADKDARSLSMVALWNADVIYLPHPAIAPWVWDVVEVLVGFPLMEEDDDVDAASQALSWLSRHAFHQVNREHLEAKTEDELRRMSNPAERLRAAIFEQLRRERERTAKMDARRGQGIPW